MKFPVVPGSPDTVIISQGDSLIIQLPSGKKIEVEVTQDTANLTIADYSLFTEEKDNDVWNQTFPTTFKVVSRKEAIEFIQNTNGKFFSLKFKKRTDGSVREMLARTGVKKNLSEDPDRKVTDFKAHDLIPVFDVQKDDYRSIPIEGIFEIMIDGEWHSVQ